jgi:alkaline phosphatase D
MSLTLGRRLLLQFGTIGAGALTIIGAAAAIAARGFTHNVASGEPSQQSDER